ncbi:hypothetical protein J6590_017908 [Homalodisca vitripennis]|nr:hypothetical protein J6590_017908 [Homalodisca vitripennis]
MKQLLRGVDSRTVGVHHNMAGVTEFSSVSWNQRTIILKDKIVQEGKHDCETVCSLLDLRESSRAD